MARIARRVFSTIPIRFFPRHDGGHHRDPQPSDLSARKGMGTGALVVKTARENGTHETGRFQCDHKHERETAAARGGWPPR